MTSSPPPAPPRAPDPPAGVPALVLEQARLGELGAAARAREAALAQPASQQQLAALERDDAAILAAYPPSAIAAAVTQRLAAPANDGGPRSGPLRLAAGVGLAAAAALALTFGGRWLADAPGREAPSSEEIARLAPPLERATPGFPPGTERTKGGPRLAIARATPTGAEPLRDGDEARAGERLQLSYAATGMATGVIVSLDGRGATTLHWPASSDAPTTLSTAPGLTSLPYAYELDDAPGFERFVFVTAPAGAPPVSAAAVLRAADQRAAAPDAASAPLELPAQWRQTSRLIRKP